MTEEKKLPEEEEKEREPAAEPAETKEESPAEQTEEKQPEAPEEEKKAKAEKKRLFSKGEKTEKFEKALKEAEDRLAAANDRMMRQMAEFDNFRKRSEKEKNAQYEIGARSVLEKLLPIVDSFERGLGSLDEAQAGEPFEQGMSQVYRQLQKMLEELQVEAISAVGKPFDANLHNAVMHVEDPEQPENTVVEEFQKGYTYRGTVIRYSMVKVAN